MWKALSCSNDRHYLQSARSKKVQIKRLFTVVLYVPSYWDTGKQ
jgi:hypothetical protein